MWMDYFCFVGELILRDIIDVLYGVINSAVMCEINCSKECKLTMTHLSSNKKLTTCEPWAQSILSMFEGNNKP